MVHPNRVIDSVLYSATSKTWKVCDFGLTAEGTSKRAHTTLSARGTACYRAPELIRERPSYNNKVDIFAMGCILYELANGGRKAFSNDFSVLQYAVSGVPFAPFLEGLAESEKTRVLECASLVS